MRLSAASQPIPPACLVVANHVSWLDVLVIDALCPATFVCKSDARQWPVLGWLIERDQALFLVRGSAKQAWRAIPAIVGRLSAGNRVALFPEGTTGDSTCVLPFRAALLQAAVDCGAPVQPIALSYSSPAAAFVGETSLWQSLCAVTSAAGLEVRIEICAPIATAGQ